MNLVENKRKLNLVNLEENSLLLPQIATSSIYIFLLSFRYRVCIYLLFSERFLIYTKILKNRIRVFFNMYCKTYVITIYMLLRRFDCVYTHIFVSPQAASSHGVFLCKHFSITKKRVTNAQLATVMILMQASEMLILDAIP